MNAPRAPITTGKASLIGGIVVGIASLVLWLAVTRDLGFHSLPVLGVGVLVAVTAGVWTRAADL